MIKQVKAYSACVCLLFFFCANAWSIDPPQVSSPPTSSAAPQKEQQVPNTSDLREAAFDKMIQALMPLTPEHIHELHAVFDRVKRATASPTDTPPRPTSSSLVVNLSPGATPPVVRLSSGFISSLIFLDATGQPWPIKAYDVGNPNAFNVQWDKKSNTLLIQAITQYKQGNLAVMLRDLNTPVMVTLLPGQRAVDYRVDMQIPRVGPNGDSATHQLPMAADPALLDVLNGIPPAGAKTLVVDGGPVQAWARHGKMFLRTALTLISPGWAAKMSASDGMVHAYVLQCAPVILASQHGKTVHIKISGF